MTTINIKRTKYPIWFSIYTIILLAFSLFAAKDKSVWVLEVFPILLGFPVLFFTYPKFQFTTLTYLLLTAQFLILCIGGIYTYAEVPFGFWMEDWFGFTRNNYDKIGHFAQGFVPAILTRELLLRTSPLQTGKWLTFITSSICLAISAFYELIEWWTAVTLHNSAEEFLGTQGYEWDSQSDMFFALTGATIALFALSKIHDKAISKTVVTAIR